MFFYEWEPSHEILRTVVIGPITREDIQQHIERVARARWFGRAELIDARAAIGSLSVSDLRTLASQFRQVSASATPAPRAVVVEELLNYCLARLFSNLVTGPARFEVFRTEAAARRWLRKHVSES